MATEIKDNMDSANTAIHDENKTCIRGNVRDLNGNALEHVAVTLKGTLLYTVSDDEGDFALCLPESLVVPGIILLIRLVGYNSIEHEVSDPDEHINLVMHETIQVGIVEESISVSFWKGIKKFFSGN